MITQWKNLEVNNKITEDKTYLKHKNKIQRLLAQFLLIFSVQYTFFDDDIMTLFSNKCLHIVNSVINIQVSSKFAAIFFQNFKMNASLLVVVQYVDSRSYQEILNFT